MLIVDLDDRELLASTLRRNAPAHAYELGDLDDFDWPHTVWFGWESGGRLEEVALLYTQPRIPVLIANGDNDIMVPTANSIDMARRIPGAELVIYEDAGHGGIFQNHADFVPKALSFLEA